MAYNHKEIEEKWQKRWAQSGAFVAHDDSPKEKKYILDMYPYPSGAGLHVGHVEGYTATDIYSRYLRMKGFEVLHPMGWDAFGLPAENYAVKTGTPPAVTTEEAIKTFTQQINSLGLSYDWTREIGTHRPDYYKWTQWLFQLLYKNDLAYRAKAKVNWCPKDQTVLANEQVVDGKCERCETEVIQKDLEQWFFRITKYVDELISGLDEIDWPESTKAAQRNWIGKSVGANLVWEVTDKEGIATEEKISTFTTRKDTIPGVTFLVLAPESEYISKVVTEGHTQECDAYILKTRSKTDLERQTNKEKSGVFSGSYAKNPFTGAIVPIYLADYVLSGYGTGAVMGMPGHDTRDREFAKLFDLPVIFTTKLPDGLKVDEIYTGEGTQINSGEEYDGLPNTEAGEKIFNALVEKGSAQALDQYRLRDWLISRQRYWGAPIPMVYDPEGNLHMVPEEHLPWLLPEDVEFMPTGESPIAKSKELKERVEKIFGEGWRPEVDTMDTFMCSSWYFFRFADPRNSEAFVDKEKIKHWLPVDMYVGGAEHTVLHLLYARFFTKVLRDLGYVAISEPFQALRHPGTILAEDGRKMSKSLGNVVNPNDVIEEFGADALRLYEMFMGPLDIAKPWNTQNINGVSRFLDKAFLVAEKVKEGETDTQTRQLVAVSIAKVSQNFEAFKFNTAVSQLMILLNHFASLDSVPKSAFEVFLQLLCPMAPHAASEMFEKLGNTNDLSMLAWPKAVTQDLEISEVSIGVQVNGKVRGTVVLPKSASQEEAFSAAKGEENVAKWLAGKTIEKAVYIPGRIISFVVV